MNQLPYMPLYWNDLLSDNKVRVQSNEEFGAYMRLLGAAWHEDIPGTLPADDDLLARLAGAELSLWRKLSRRILPCFVLNEETGRYEQKRMIEEYAKVVAQAEMKRARAMAGAMSKWGNQGQTNQLKRSERLTVARQLASHSPHEWTTLLQVVPHCGRCGADEPLVKDHILPISKGGSDGIENLQPLCRKCSSSKGPDETDFRPADWHERLNACLSRHQAGIKQTETPAIQNQSQNQIAEGSAEGGVAAAADEPPPASKPAAAPKGKKTQMTDEEYIADLARDPAYVGIDVPREAAKMQRWCGEHRKQPSRRRLINWLNRVDRPMSFHGEDMFANRPAAPPVGNREPTPEQISAWLDTMPGYAAKRSEWTTWNDLPPFARGEFHQYRLKLKSPAVPIPA